MIVKKNIPEVLRYLGIHEKEYRDDKTLNYIDQAYAECTVLRPKSTFSEITVSAENGKVTSESFSLDSENLCRHLSGCKKAVLFAATLGQQADVLLKKASLKRMSYALVLQAVLTTVLEDYADETFKSMLEPRFSKDGLYLRSRFSPGYGDLDLSVQPVFLGVLEAGKRIGLTATESFMLNPVKSITAIIGISEIQEEKHEKCLNCAKEDCTFRSRK